MRILSTIAVLILAAFPVHSQEEEAPVMDENTARCVSLRSVRRTDIIDDRNILFYMRGGDVYHNILPRNCNGLAREDRFSYKTSLGRLCQLDTVTVLYSAGSILREGNSCSLGYFHKITEEEARAFKEQVDEGPKAEPLPMPEPGEVDDKNDEESGDPESR